MKHSPPDIHGHVEPGFEQVRDEFERNFAQRGEVGAACAVYRDGQPVVDLWGGWRDSARRLPWREDTLVLVFSVTKGLAGLALALAHSRGLFDHDAPVAEYWPEFAQQGKQAVTVRQLLAHQAGLCAIDAPLDAAIVADHEQLAKILARQVPAWNPGAKQGYHGITLGWYESELLRRVDPRRRGLGRFFQEELAEPLGLEFRIGTPDDVPEDRIAVIEDYKPMDMLLHLHEMAWPFVRATLKPRTLTHRSLMNPRFERPGDMGRPPWRGLEMPASNGIGQVRAIAQAYGQFATGGPALGLSPATFQALQAAAVPPTDGWFDEVLRMNARYSLGFMRPFPEFDFAGARAFGAPGLGGSLGFADPERRIGYAYAPNKCGFLPWNDPRERALRQALDRCLERAASAREAK
jgi:CubicO group peptidase (beta-lactamase class C family)